MSRPPAAGFLPSPTDDASRRPQHATPQMSPTHPQLSMNPYVREGYQEGVANHPMSLPPMRQLSTSPPTPSSERRPGNLHSILNPQDALAEQQQARRRSASQMESPSPVETQHPPSLPSISRPTSVGSTRGEIAPPRPFQPPPSRMPGRHLLSPRSPNLHRTQSLGVLGAPTGTIDAHQSPFLSPSTRPSGSEAIVSQPPLPTPPVGLRAGYFPPVPPTAPTPPPGINPLRDIRRQSQNFPQSGSASPIMSYSPYSQPASVSSSQFENSSQQGSYVTVSNGQQSQQDYGNPPIAMETERNFIPMAPSSQSSIQIMTIKSQQGHQVQIPVDVQAASKLADEKRKRNAGASARFRARRKEKEREASMSIARLEQQIREAAEDIDFYRNERDYFKSVVFAQPGAERHYARPPSPRLRRISVAPSVSSSGRGPRSGSPYSSYSDSPEANPERNVRRRTSSYHPPPGAVPTHINGTNSQHQPYPTASFPPMNPPPTTRAPLPPPPPPQSYDPRDPRAFSEGQVPSSHGLGFRNPFANEPGRFDNRHWAPGQGRDSRD